MQEVFHVKLYFISFICSEYRILSLYGRLVHQAGIIVDMGLSFALDHGLSRGRLIEPVAIDLRALWRKPANDDRSLRRSKGVMVDPQPVAGNVGSIFAVASSMHIKAVRQGG